jgi:histidine triad (HIT) family protein
MEAPAELVAAVNHRMPKIARAVLAATGVKACHVLVNNGAEAQQSVGHLHYHILPRESGDGFGIPWKAGSLEKQAAAALASAMARGIAS